MSHANPAGETFPYLDLEGKLSALDRRSATYQFDLEQDLPWIRIAESGLYLPPDYVRDLGFDADALMAEPEAWQLFQWAAALLGCEGFAIAEKLIIDFFDGNDRLLRQRSNQLLHAEELKHIELFRRVGDHLRAARPEWTFTFDRICFETNSMPRGMVLLDEIEEPALRHAAFWQAVVFFEEVTIYLHKRLTSAPDVQPFWKAVHHAHAREEIQHLQTDMAHVEALRGNAQLWSTAASWLVHAIRNDFDFTFFVRVAAQMVAEAFPGLRFNQGRPVEETAVYRDIVERDPIFRRTRRFLEEGAGR